MTVLEPKHFFDSLTDEDIVIFLAVLQEQRQQFLVPISDKLSETGREESCLLFMHLFFESGTRYLSVKMVVWYNFITKEFDSVIKDIIEYRDEHELELLNRAERLLSEAITQNQPQ